MNKEMLFVINDNIGIPDTISFNYKLFFDTTDIKKGSIYIPNMGIYYHCYLKKDSVYTIVLNPVKAQEFDEFLNIDYYIANCYFPDSTSNKFIERDSSFMGPIRKWNRYVDRNNNLYIIDYLTPTCDCIWH